MKLFNYLKAVGAFTNAQQLINLSVEPTDRQERKMLEEANDLLGKGWERRKAYLHERNAKSDDPDLDFDPEKLREEFFPVVKDGIVGMPLQYLQDYMVKKMAAMQNNVSIHNTKEVKELLEVFGDYKVQLVSKFEGLVFDFINWTARDRQKPKLLVHAKDADGEEVVIRFEAASELCQKFLNAALELSLKPGTVFSLAVEAVDPAHEKNKRAGKKVAELGKYVNHNVVVTVGDLSHNGRPPKGERFVQKPTIEFLEKLYRHAQTATQSEGKAQGQRPVQRGVAPVPETDATPAPASAPAAASKVAAPAPEPAAQPVFNDDI